MAARLTGRKLPCPLPAPILDSALHPTRPPISAIAQSAGAHSQQPRADLTLLAMTISWGATFTVVKDSLAFASPGAFLTARFTIATLVALAIARRSLFHRPSVRAGLLLGVLLFLGFAFQTWGLRYTTPTRSAFLTGLAVVLVPLFRALVFKKPVHNASWAGACLAVLGLFQMSAPSLLLGGATLLGDLLTLCCAVCFALGIVVTERAAPDVKPGAAAAVQIAVTAVLSMLTLAFEEVRFIPTPSLWTSLVITGVFNTAIAFFLQLWAQARTTAIRAALIFSLEPLFAALFAHLLAGEPLVREVAQGGSLILLGILTAELWPRLELRRAAGAQALQEPR